MNCNNTYRDTSSQPFPTTGTLGQHRNFDLLSIKSLYAKDESLVYYYVIATVLNKEGSFVQTGSAPNFQGGIISLCTCKRFMRTFFKPKHWEGKWVAGFSGLDAGKRRNALVFLMRINHAYSSYAELWAAGEITKQTKLAKSASRDSFGDLYEPIADGGCPYDPKSYKNPLEIHVHHDDSEWHRDIDYENRFGQKPAYLFGEPEYSYFWNKPMIYLPNSIGIGQRKSQLKDLIKELEG